MPGKSYTCSFSKCKTLNFILGYPQCIYNETCYILVLWNEIEFTDNFQIRKYVMVYTCNLNMWEAKAEES